MPFGVGVTGEAAQNRSVCVRACVRVWVQRVPTACATPTVLHPEPAQGPCKEFCSRPRIRRALGAARPHARGLCAPRRQVADVMVPCSPFQMIQPVAYRHESVPAEAAPLHATGRATCGLASVAARETSRVPFARLNRAILSWGRRGVLAFVARRVIRAQWVRCTNGRKSVREEGHGVMGACGA